MNRCGRLAFLAVVALSTVVGCGEDDFSDDAYGAIDLTPFFVDGASAANPRAAVPAEMRPTKGWYEGNRAEFYDFGLANHRRKRNAAGATIREPDIAYVNQMYFFFDCGGEADVLEAAVRPPDRHLVHEGRREHARSEPGRLPPSGDTDKILRPTPYSQRPRRHGGRSRSQQRDDYQRPIIDKLANDSTYTGLWEVVQVKTQAATCPTRSRAGRRWRRPSTPRRSPSTAR